MSTITVRRPDFDFTGVSPRWGSNLDAVHGINATGMIPAYIEPYLIKVLRLARNELDPEQYPALIEDIDAFIKQEAQHYKLHASLNKVIREDGAYTRMADFEREYEAEYVDFLKKPLQWQLAYCDGFEAMGSATASLTVSDDYPRQFGDDVDPRPVALWQWHIAEEYEHRNVVFQTYKALYGDRPVRAWIARVRGFVFCSRHLMERINALKQYLIDTDLARMTDAERAAYEAQRPPQATGPLAQFRQGFGSMKGPSLVRILRVFSPFYDPAGIPPPSAYRKVLAHYD